MELELEKVNNKNHTLTNTIEEINSNNQTLIEKIKVLNTKITNKDFEINELRESL